MNSRRPARGSPAARARPRGQVGAAPERLEVTLDGLRQLRDRIRQFQLEPGDWPVLDALVSNQIVRTEERNERRIAKVAAAAAAAEDTSGPEASGHAGGSTGSSSSSSTSATSGSVSSGANTASGDEPASPPRGVGEPTPGDSKRSKGHGRNGASAYRQARHFSHGLAPGEIGALCEACGLGRMYRYREKIVIRIVGQPLFGAESHHHEQARCRRCGHIVRAQGPACVHEGLGTDYVRYDWSACAMLLVMHYFGGAPFKRLESLHEGWGVPMPDANQWQVVSAGDDLLLPLYKALEQHAIQKATNFRIDDTGSMVIAIQKQIDAELAALESLGESTKDVRTGINATGLYWETPNGPVILFYTGRHHAGEIVDRVLRHRLLSSPKLVKCTDGASKNFAHEHADQLVESTCNAHAFLKFRAIKDKHPVEYAEAGRVYQQVFDHDDEAKALGLTPVRSNAPSSEALEASARAAEEDVRGEDHQQAGRAELAALGAPDLHHQSVGPADSLLQRAGCPARHEPGRAGAHHAGPLPRGVFNYQTEDGAAVGDHAMSLIATARANEVEPVAWLAECLRCHEDLAQRPEHYLPWVYRERLEGANTSGAAPRAPPPPRPRLEPEPGLSAQSA